MEKMRFDEGFETLLLSGNLHNIANYRNCIIDEERRRANHQSRQSAREIYVSTMEDARMGKKYAAVYMIATWLISLICTICLIINIRNSLWLLAALVGLGALFNAGSATKCTGIYLLYRFAYNEFKKGNITVVRQKDKYEKTFPEFFSVISEDTEEVLRIKKAKLDEILGL